MSPSQNSKDEWNQQNEFSGKIGDNCFGYPTQLQRGKGDPCRKKEK